MGTLPLAGPPASEDRRLHVKRLPETELEFTSELTVELIQRMGGDHMVVAAARVSSNGPGARAWADPAHQADNARLIDELVARRHGSPFRHAGLTFFMDLPLDIWAQMRTHRIGVAQHDEWDESTAWNNESHRYRPARPKFHLPARVRPMMRPEGFRPMDPDFLVASDPEYDRFVEDTKNHAAVCWGRFRAAVEAGYAYELCRRYLPPSVYAAGWFTCNPASLSLALSLRIDDPANRSPTRPQYEIEQAMRLAEAAFKQGWPLTHAAWHRHGRVAL